MSKTSNLPSNVAGKELVKVLGSMSVETFNKIVKRHNLVPSEVVDLRVNYQISIPYMDKMLKRGFTLPYIAVAYQLREELGSLNDPDRSTGQLVCDFMLPIHSSLSLLKAFCPNEDDLCDEQVEAIANVLSAMADECNEVITWSTLVEILLELLGESNDTIFCEVCMSPDEIVEELMAKFKLHKAESASDARLDYDLWEVNS